MFLSKFVGGNIVNEEDEYDNYEPSKGVYYDLETLENSVCLDLYSV